MASSDGSHTANKTLSSKEWSPEIHRLPAGGEGKALVENH